MKKFIHCCGLTVLGTVLVLAADLETEFINSVQPFRSGHCGSNGIKTIYVSGQ